MVIFKYEISPTTIRVLPNPTEFDNVKLRITIENTPENNVTIINDGRKITATLPETEINQIIELYARNPQIFDIRELEPNGVLDGDCFKFFFTDGAKTANVTAFNIGYYGDIPHPNAELYIRIVKSVREILDRNHIRTS